MIPFPLGPNKSPSERNPRMGEKLSFWQMGVLSAVARRRIMVSALGPFMKDRRPLDDSVIMVMGDMDPPRGIDRGFILVLEFLLTLLRVVNFDLLIAIAVFASSD